MAEEKGFSSSLHIRAGRLVVNARLATVKVAQKEGRTVARPRKKKDRANKDHVP